MELVPLGTAEYCMTEANDETRDEVTLDLGGSFFDENLHSAKHGHSRRKTFTHFDSILSF